MPRETDIAWAAGLFEGEGTAMVTKPQGQPRLSLVMTDEDVVQRFADIVGVGTVRTYRRPPNKRYWLWCVANKDGTLACAALLWPHLGERRREAVMGVVERASKMHDGAGYCNRGHDLSDPKHLYVHAKTGKRHCRTCRVKKTAAWKERRRLPRLAG